MPAGPPRPKKYRAKTQLFLDDDSCAAIEPGRRRILFRAVGRLLAGPGPLDVDAPRTDPHKYGYLPSMPSDKPVKTPVEYILTNFLSGH